MDIQAINKLKKIQEYTHTKITHKHIPLAVNAIKLSRVAELLENSSIHW